MPDREVIVEEKAILRLFGSDETALCSLLSLFLVYFSSQNYSPNSFTFIPSVFGTRWVYIFLRPLVILLRCDRPLYSAMIHEFPLSNNSTCAFMVRILPKASHP